MTEVALAYDLCVTRRSLADSCKYQFPNIIFWDGEMTAPTGWFADPRILLYHAKKVKI